MGSYVSFYRFKCAFCTRETKVPLYRKDTAKYCSRRCLALDARTRVARDCVICGKEFEHISSRCNKAKYCSRKCYYKAQHLKGTIIYRCHHCERKFRGAPSHKRKYCSRGCVRKANHRIWKPSFSFVRKAMEARGLIVRCERCGYDKEPRILGIHHRDRNPRNNNLSNLEVICPNCHSLEHRKHITHGWQK